MRTTFRLLTSAALGAALLLSLGVGATFAGEADKGAPNKPTIEKIDLGDAWCFQDVVLRYCNAREGTLTIETRPDGSSKSKVDLVTRTVVTDDGAFVSKSVMTVKDRTESGADGSYKTDQRERTVYTDADQTCTSESHFKAVDFEVIVDTLKGHCH